MVLRLVREPIVQEVLTGPEITIDALLDLDGRPIHYVPRRRIRTLGGESIQGVTLEHDTAFETWIEDVLDRCSEMGARGPLTLQAFMGTAGPVLSEINARFGGGFPLALEAGGAYPGWLLDMIDGVAVRPRLARVRNGRLHDPRQRRALRPPAEMVIRGVVLDMDDTLYLERDYVRSGFAAIARDAGRSAAEIDRTRRLVVGGLRGRCPRRHLRSVARCIPRGRLAPLDGRAGRCLSGTRAGDRPLGQRPARRSIGWRPSACGWAS